jgi:hypothetical protein
VELFASEIALLIIISSTTLNLNKVATHHWQKSTQMMGERILNMRKTI